MRKALNRLIVDDRWTCVALCVAVFLLLWPGLRDHVSVKWGMRYFWMLLLPIVVRVRTPGQRSLRYLWVVVPLLVLSLSQPHPLFRFFLLFATIFLVVESFVGKLDRLAPLFATLIAPITHYFFNNFGSSVRLGISGAAAGTLRMFDQHATAMGNAIRFHGDEFHVDPDCMGLRMITTSLLVVMALVALLERRKGTRLPTLALPALLGITVVLVAACNYARVLLLVLTSAPAGSAAHEIIGLACWVVLLLLPMAIVADRWTARAPAETVEHLVLWPVWKRSFAAAMLLPVTIAAFAHPVIPVEGTRDILAEQLVLNGCQRSILPNKVVRFDGDGVLIYIKPGRPFYSDDHHPMSCWLGSGFTFTHEVVEDFRDGEICMGLLISGDEQRYTAWWYDNGRVRTVGQLDWRWRAAHGEGPFRLVNVTADSPQRLMNEVSRLFTALAYPA